MLYQLLCGVQKANLSVNLLMIMMNIEHQPSHSHSLLSHAAVWLQVQVQVLLTQSLLVVVLIVIVTLLLHYIMHYVARERRVVVVVVVVLVLVRVVRPPSVT